MAPGPTADHARAAHCLPSAAPGQRACQWPTVHRAKAFRACANSCQFQQTLSPESEACFGFARLSRLATSATASAQAGQLPTPGREDDTRQQMRKSGSTTAHLAATDPGQQRWRTARRGRRAPALKTWQLPGAGQGPFQPRCPGAQWPGSRRMLPPACRSHLQPGIDQQAASGLKTCMPGAHCQHSIMLGVTAIVP